MKASLVVLLVALAFALVGCPRSQPPAEYVTPPSGKMGAATSHVALVPTAGVATSNGTQLGAVPITDDGGVLTILGGVPQFAAPSSGGITKVNAVGDLPTMAQTIASDWTSGSFSAGHSFIVPEQTIVVTGVRFYAQFSGGGSKTIKARLCSYPAGNTSAGTVTGSPTTIDTQTASIASGTVATITFGSPHTITPTMATAYSVSVWETSGTYYTKTTAPAGAMSWFASINISSASPAYVMSVVNDTGVLYWLGTGQYHSGDGCIDTGGYAIYQTEFYPVMPVLQ